MDINISFPTVVTSLRLVEAPRVIVSRIRYLFTASPEVGGAWYISGVSSEQLHKNGAVWLGSTRLRPNVDYLVRGPAIIFVHPPSCHR